MRVGDILTVKPTIFMTIGADDLKPMPGRVRSFRDVCYQSVYRNLDVLPSDSELWAMDMSTVKTVGRGMDAISKLAEEAADVYDTMVIDCPLCFSPSCISAILASTTVVIPAIPDAYSADGIDEITTQLRSIRSLKPSAQIGGILLTNIHRADVIEDAVKMIRESCEVHVYNTMIRRTDKAIESTFARMPVYAWSPRSAATVDYRKFVEELLTQQEIQNTVEGVLKNG